MTNAERCKKWRIEHGIQGKHRRYKHSRKCLDCGVVKTRQNTHWWMRHKAGCKQPKMYSSSRCKECYSKWRKERRKWTEANREADTAYKQRTRRALRLMRDWEAQQRYREQFEPLNIPRMRTLREAEMYNIDK